VRYKANGHFWKFLELLGKTHGRFGKKKKKQESLRKKQRFIDY
jgi:hypothetical protein